MDSDRLIAKYFLNQLSAEEQKEFDTLMSSNPEFKEQVAFEAKVKKSIFQQEHTNQKEELQAVESSLPVKQTPTKWYLVAATIALLITMGIMWTFNSATPEKLFENYYTVASNTTHPIVRDNSISDNLTKAFIAYERKQYNKAQTLFNNLYTTSNNTELLFYEAICHLEMDKTQLAIETFIKHKEFNDKLTGKSNWYLALAFLKAGDVENAKETLRDIISKPESYHFKQAQELLSKL